MIREAVLFLERFFLFMGRTEDHHGAGLQVVNLAQGAAVSLWVSHDVSITSSQGLPLPGGGA